MLALMKPSRVATRSSTRGTSCGVTVVTRTSGTGGPACGAFREQPATNNAPTAKAATTADLFTIGLWHFAPKCRAPIPPVTVAQFVLVQAQEFWRGAL